MMSQDKRMQAGKRNERPGTEGMCSGLQRATCFAVCLTIGSCTGHFFQMLIASSQME